MARRPAAGEDRRKQILEAALKVFADKGFKGATNQAIATEAGGISPGLIYWYFESKEDMFFALLEERLAAGSLPPPLEQLKAFPPEHVLPMIAHFALSRLDNQETINLFKIFAGEAVYSERIRAIANKNINRLLGPLSAYLEAQMDQGKLRRDDPMLCAQTFAVSLFAAIMRRQFLADPGFLAYSAEQIVNTEVGIFLRGLRPD
ncbi:MAG TPA: TetR/AcrR family transcriptional regulator [Ktedonobacterales bacterium]|nr:TetR/AcrR family transcriptional regulator [Ktedonobacterales bacterium]